MTETGKSATYYVISWDTREILSEHKGLGLARRYCRGNGHTGEIYGNRYTPVAYVANEAGECVYNPVFSTKFGPAAGAAVISLDDNLR